MHNVLSAFPRPLGDLVHCVEINRDHYFLLRVLNEESHMLAVLMTGVMSSICVHLSATGKNVKEFKVDPAQGRPVFACSCFYSILLPPRFQQLHTNIAPRPTQQKRRIKETMQADTCASLYLSLNVCIMDG